MQTHFGKRRFAGVRERETSTAGGNVQRCVETVCHSVAHPEYLLFYIDIATVISNKCVNPDTKRPYPVSIIEKAMKECHIAVKPNKTSKQQALDTIGKLKANLPIERASMKMKIVSPLKASTKIRKYLSKQAQNVKIESEEKEGDSMVIVVSSSPGLYRDIEQLVRDETQGAGSLELLCLVEVRDDEEKLE